MIFDSLFLNLMAMKLQLGNKKNLIVQVETYFVHIS